MYKADDVRRAAKGNWGKILGALAPELEKALGRVGRHVPCPVHGGKDGFRLFKKDFEDAGGGICNSCGARHDGFKLLMWLRNWRFPEALTAVANFLRLEEVDASKQVVRVAAPVKTVPTYQYRSDAENAKLLERINSLWAEAVPVSHPQAMVAQRYLGRRKLSVRYAGKLHQALRFHPRVPYFDEEQGRVTAYYPALLCNISDKDGVLVTLHRQYLSPDGYLAPVSSPKKMMPVPNGKTVTGCSIKLGTPTGSALGIAEGLETALSGHHGSGMTVWSTVNATLMESFQPPAGIRLVVVWADLDRSQRGEQAAKKIKGQLWESGVKAQILLPPMAIPEDRSGVDWNDVWVDCGHAGFPHRAAYPRVA